MARFTAPLARLLLLAGVFALFSLPLAVAQDAEMPTEILEGFAVLPADTFAEGPASGAFIPETDDTNGRTVPFESQPVQGVSGIIPLDNGNWLALSDNGFGSQANSTDYLLRLYELNIDWAAGTVGVVGFIQLSDPNRLIPFPIINNDAEGRLLTGSDFDIESIRRTADGSLWIGDEFGPWLLQFDAEGVLLQAPIATPIPDVLAPYARGMEFVMAPQNPAFADLADNDARNAAANHRTSRGFEGMALSADGATLYTLLEGSMADDPLGQRLLISEFSLADNAYTGRTFFYPMSQPGHAIGEMTAVNDSQFLVIERDGNQGEAAAFKRIFLVDISAAAPDGVLRKTLVVDLMAIADPNGLTTAADNIIGFGPVFSFPFVTIESVYPVDADTLLVVNDNNYPFSTGRRPEDTPDDTEFILVTLPQPLDLAQ